MKKEHNKYAMSVYSAIKYLQEFRDWNSWTEKEKINILKIIGLLETMEDKIQENNYQEKKYPEKEENKQTFEGAKFIEKIRVILNEVEEMLFQKNQSYGNVWKEPLNIFSKNNSKDGLKARIDDKLARIKFGNGEYNEDTILDLIGYLVLLKMEEKNGN